MKKSRLFICSFAFLLTFSIGLTSCNAGETSTSDSSNESSSSTSSHTHTFDETSWEYDNKYHWHKSMCGHDVVDVKASHTFKDEVIKPTYENEGYTTHTCTVCEYSYTDSNTSKLEHNYSSTWSYNESSHWRACIDESYENLKKDESSHNIKVTTIEPTYESGGYTLHKCEVCDYSYKTNEADKLLHKYTITWKNYDGTTLETDNDVIEGTLPTYDGATPSKPDDETYTYTFTGWTPEVTVASHDQIYTATYSSKKITYTIEFDLNGGTSSSYKGSQVVEEFSEIVFFFDCIKDGYNFRGWSYNGVKIFDENGNQLATPTMSKTMTFVAEYSDTAKLTITTNMADAGTISGEGEYEYNTDVDLSAYAKPGYVFMGWYTQGILISSAENYTYNIGNKDVYFEAKFKLDAFTLKINSNNSNYGLVNLNVTDEEQEYKELFSGNFDYMSQITIVAQSKTNVKFLGWYNDNKLVSAQAIYTFTMPNYDYYLEAKWNFFTVSYNLNNGIQNDSNPDSYTVEDKSLTLYEPTKTGYKFLGWKYNGDIITSIDSSWIDNITLDAIWEATTYSITYHLDGGINSSSNPSSFDIEDSDITLEIPSKTGYTFDGWYSDSSFENKIEVIETGSYGDVNLYAKWELTAYSITYYYRGGRETSSSNPSTYTIESEFKLNSPTKTGYTFAGWYNGVTLVSSIEKGMTGNLTLEAKWTANKNNLSVTSEDTSNGTVEIESGSGYSDKYIKVVASPADGCAFKGWYNGETRVSQDSTYTFNMPTSDYSLVARFYSKAEKEEQDKKLGIIPDINKTNNTLTYGLYPQTYVSDEAITSELNKITRTESNGWYLYNDEYYAKRTAETYYSGYTYTFSDGTPIVSGETYWFKCEPIEWKILKISNGYYDIVSNVLLDTHRYNVSYMGTKNGCYANNYASSEIRGWLNGDFLNTAFNLDKAFVTLSVVLNEAITTDSFDNPYACGNTEDYIYLLSYQDYLNTSYFADANARKCKVSDYALANEAAQDDGYGYYWTRSPSSQSSVFPQAWTVNSGGSLSYQMSTVGYTHYCVRPSLCIAI